MQHITSHQQLREVIALWKQEGRSIGFVPTMGALHAGHLTLVQNSIAANDKTVVSIFVNPTQFGPNEDFARYPRTLEDDVTWLHDTGADILYTPEVRDIYPAGFASSVKVANIGDALCGVFRPGHFEGVATVVSILLNQVGADNAYFGEKDWQQLQIVKRMTQDLAIPTIIHGVPTLREDDGLALSSRNRYLNADERMKAALLIKTLRALAENIRKHPAQTELFLTTEKQKLLDAGFRVDYLELATADTCTPTRNLGGPARVFVAARLGNTRLIDNLEVGG